MGATYSALYSAVYGVDQDTKKPFDIDSLKKELNVLRDELQVLDLGDPRLRGSDGGQPLTVSEVERANLIRKLTLLEDENARLAKDLLSARQEIVRIREAQVLEISTMRDLGRSVESRNAELLKKNAELTQQNSLLTSEHERMTVAIAVEREEMDKRRAKLEEQERRLKAKVAADVANVLEPCRKTFEWICSSGASALFSQTRSSGSPSHTMHMHLWTLLLKRGSGAGALDAIKTAAEHLRLDPNAFTFDTPLILAIESDGSAELVQMLLELGANPNFTQNEAQGGKGGKGPLRIQGALFAAAKKRRFDLLPILAAHGARPVFVRVANPTSTTLLEELAYSLNALRPDDVVAVCRELLKYYPKLPLAAKESMRYSADDRTHLAVKALIKESALSLSQGSQSAAAGDSAATPSPRVATGTGTGTTPRGDSAAADLSPAVSTRSAGLIATPSPRFSGTNGPTSGLATGTSSPRPGGRTERSKSPGRTPAVIAEVSPGPGRAPVLSVRRA